ncbi:MAG: hypothetical protein IJC61_00870, partial [Oscillospiraceae bacterium]|nr:hypothetical protein [Oscillospiraceae bacterium]
MNPTTPLMRWLLILAPVVCCVFASRGILHYFQLESYQFPGYFRTLKRNRRHSFLPGVCAAVAMLLVLYMFDLLVIRSQSALTATVVQVALLPACALVGFLIAKLFTEKKAKK